MLYRLVINTYFDSESREIGYYWSVVSVDKAAAAYCLRHFQAGMKLPLRRQMVEHVRYGRYQAAMDLYCQLGDCGFVTTEVHPTRDPHESLVQATQQAEEKNAAMTGEDDE